jgi:signal transduction histidine kinase
MRERAEELGGRLAIVPLSPNGTEVSAWLPLA